MQATPHSGVSGQGPRRNNIVRGGGRRRKVVDDTGLPPGRIVLVLAIVVGCFGILWPRIFSPLLLGDTPPPARTDDEAILGDPANPSRGFLNPNMKEGGPPGRGRPPLPVRTIDKEWKGRGGPMPGMRPTMGGPGIQPTQNKTGGTLGVMMPMYTIAIIVFFVYTTFKVMSKKKDDEDEEEEGDERMFAENIKYDEDYYNNYIKNYLNDGRLKEENPEEEQKTHETNLSSGHCPSIQKLLKEDNMNKIDSKVESGGNGNNDDENLQNINPETTDNEDDESLQNLKPEIRNEEENAQNSRIENVEGNEDNNLEEEKQGKEENETNSSHDPRDLEIQVLKARLEQTEAALERIVAHMGSVTARLAQGREQGDCCSHAGGEEK